MSDSKLTSVRLTGTTLERVRFVDVVLEDCELSGATIEAATLERTTIKRSRMSTLVAPDLTATDVVVEDVKADGAWLRMATLLRCDFHDCDLSAADLYSSKVTDSRILRCNLDGAELTSMKCERVAVHGSTFTDVHGAAGLRGVVIGSDQIVEPCSRPARERSTSPSTTTLTDDQPVPEANSSSTKNRALPPDGQGPSERGGSAATR